MLLAVNYHYVQPEGAYPFAGIHPISPDALRAQLLELGKTLEFVGGDAVLAAARGARALPERACAITFDDGLAEQATQAAAVLDSLGIPGMFFLCTQPWVERKGLVVHKLHWLRATRPPEAFLALADRHGRALNICYNPGEINDAAAGRQYLYDKPETRRLKYWLNHLLPANQLARLVEAMFRECCETDEEAFCRQWYMSESQAANLARRHTIGSQAHSHSPLASMSGAEMSAELSRSKGALEAVIGAPVEMVSYPYGGPTAVTPAVAAAAEAAGYRAGFTMERSLNHTLQQPLLLARLSANDAPGGSAPLLALEGEGWRVTAPMTTARRRYFHEEEAAASAV